MIKVLIISVVVILAIYIAVFVMAVLIQRIVIYPASQQTDKNCKKNIADSTVVHNGTTLYQYHPEGADTVVIFYHGNGHNVCDLEFLMDIFVKNNVAYIFPEYTGYGSSAGKTTHSEVLKNVRDTVDYVQEKKYKNVYIVGQSIGSGAAAYHTTLQVPQRLLLITPFTTLTDVIANMLSIYPEALIEMFFDNEFDNVKRLKNYTGVLTIIHGTKDTVVPLKQSKQLFNTIKSQDKKFIIAPGYRHANITQSQELKDVINEFLQ